jgi:hypothetical protein
LLLMNEGTQVGLQTATQTSLSRGEAEEALTPGTQHDVLTPAGLVHAIGTAFDVRYRSSMMTVVVVEGSAEVSDILGSVVVETGQKTIVRIGSPPSAPVLVGTSSVARWTSDIPPPKARPRVNIALAANGGKVVGASSIRAGPPGSPGTWDAANAIDGRLSRGWQSAAGQTANQFLIVSFPRSAQFTVTAVVLDCTATGGQPSGDALRGFDLRVSGDLSGLASFKTVFSGTCRHAVGLQVFHLPAPVMTGYLMLYCKTNWGGSEGIALAEMEVVSPDRL